MPDRPVPSTTNGLAWAEDLQHCYMQSCVDVHTKCTCFPSPTDRAHDHLHKPVQQAHSKCQASALHNAGLDASALRSTAQQTRHCSAAHNGRIGRLCHRPICECTSHKSALSIPQVLLCNVGLQFDVCLQTGCCILLGVVNGAGSHAAPLCCRA